VKEDEIYLGIGEYYKVAFNWKWENCGCGGEKQPICFVRGWK
jgi:hypothetical protein